MRRLEELKDRMRKVPEKYLRHRFPPLENGQSVVGKCPEEFRRLYGVFMELDEEARRIVAEHDLAEHHPEQKCLEMVRRASGKRGEAMAVRNLFWTALRRELETPHGNLGLRGDWDLITWEDREEEDPLDVLLMIRDILTRRNPEVRGKEELN